MKWESSTKGCVVVMSAWCASVGPHVGLLAGCVIVGRSFFGVSGESTYHKKSPDGVVGEDGAGDNKHCEADETIELVGIVR